MFRTNKASFNANVQKEEMGITQLSTSVLTNVGVYNLYKTLTADFSYSEKKSFYCSISKMEITYNGIEKHLYSEKNRIHIYLTKGNDKRLINYILEQFPNIEKASELLSSKKEVANATVDKTLKEIFDSVNDDLNSGLSFTQALMAYRDEVGDVTIALVELGESTGNMAESLEKLAEILEEIEENRQKFKKALRYPITVVTAIAIAFTILMVYVVPKFKDIFSKLKAELPLPTKILLFMENLINYYGFYLLAT